MKSRQQEYFSDSGVRSDQTVSRRKVPFHRRIISDLPFGELRLQNARHRSHPDPAKTFEELFRVALPMVSRISPEQEGLTAAALIPQLPSCSCTPRKFLQIREFA